MLDKCFNLYLRARINELTSDNLRSILLPAYAESPSYCMKTLLLIRGQKSIENRRFIFMESFKLIHSLFIAEDIHWLNLVKYIPMVGRWDDLLYSWVNSDSYKYRTVVGKYLKHVYKEDLKEINKGKLPKTLLSKWMPSYTNGKSVKGQLSKSLAKNFGIDKVAYTKNLSLLRSKVDLIIDIYSSQLKIDEFLSIRNPIELEEFLDEYFKYEGDA